MFHCASEHSDTAAVLRPAAYPKGRVAYESGEFRGRDEHECGGHTGDCDYDRHDREYGADDSSKFTFSSAWRRSVDIWADTDDASSSSSSLGSRKGDLPQHQE